MKTYKLPENILRFNKLEIIDSSIYFLKDSLFYIYFIKRNKNKIGIASWSTITNYYGEEIVLDLSKVKTGINYKELLKTKEFHQFKHYKFPENHLGFKLIAFPESKSGYNEHSIVLYHKSNAAIVIDIINKDVEIKCLI